MIWMRIPIAAAVLLLSGSGCMQGPAQGSDDGRPTVFEGGYEEAWERYLAAAVPSAGGGLVIEGDLYFASENELRDYFDERMSEESNKAHAFQRISDGYIPAYEFPESVNIRYCVSNDFGTGKSMWADRIREAASAWEDVTNVRFTYLSEFDDACTSTTAEVDFAAVRYDALQGYCGLSKLGWNTCAISSTSRVTGVLVIDTDLAFGVAAAPNVTTIGALRHELGHMLGLRHEHPWRSVIATPCGSATENPTVPLLDTTGIQLGNEEYDWNSVMHYPYDGTPAGSFNCGGNRESDLSITVFDQHSIQVLYGMHPAWLAALAPSI